jgi:putative tricarboxylic transport membrane protein
MFFRKEVLSSLVLILFGAVFLLYDIKYPLDELANPGPGVFPLLVGTVLAILAALQLVRSLRKMKPPGGENEGTEEARPVTETPRRDAGARVLLMIAVFVVYLLMVKWVGFFASNFLFVIVSSRLLGAKDWKSPILLSVGIDLFCYLLFEVWLKVSFPRGILF